MKQVVGFLNVIQKAHLLDSYSQLSIHGAIHGCKLPSIDEFLSLSLKETDAGAFDDKTDKLLEAQALKRLEERRKNVE